MHSKGFEPPSSEPESIEIIFLYLVKIRLYLLIKANFTLFHVTSKNSLQLPLLLNFEQMFYRYFADIEYCHGNSKRICAQTLTKKDGTFNVKIRLPHNRASRYLDTQQYVTRKQLDKDFKIKDAIVSKPINLLLDKLRDSIAKLEGQLEFFTCEDLMAHLQNEEKPIDFIAFSKKVVDDLTKDGRKSTANNFNAIANSLVGYFKRSTVLITDINSLMLKSYEKYLLTARIMKRVHRNGKEFTITRKGLSASGLHNHMRDLRWLFNVAKETFNNEELGTIRISHYPFKAYKI